MRTQMPPGGAATRGAQLATLTKHAKDFFVSDRTARLLDAAEAEMAGADADADNARALQQTRDAYELKKRIPAALLGRLADQLARGEYAGLLAWLTEAIYQHGRAYSTDELLRRISGEGLSVTPLLVYLERKYSDLYELN